MAKPTQPPPIVITNFSGRLTRIINGDLNSGFAKFTNSFGYDPFSKPLNLTWFEQPTPIASVISDVLLVSKVRNEVGNPIVYAVGSDKHMYQIQPSSASNPNLDSVIGIGSVAVNSPSFNYGASMEFFGTPERLYVSSDTQINSFPISSITTGAFGGDAIVGSAPFFVNNTYHPLKPFQGNLTFGNGPTIGTIGTTNTITSSIIGMSVGQLGATQNLYSALNPPFPPEKNVMDLDISPDYNYLLITSSEVSPENIITLADDRQTVTQGNGDIFQWNGSDAATTAGLTIPAQALTALQTYLQKNLMFANDTFGLSIGDGVNKILYLPGNKAPLPNATGVNGDFLFWMSTELATDNSTIYASLYYWGQLDQETPVGLYRILRYNTALPAGYVYQVPMNTLISNLFKSINNAITSISTFAYGKHYFSTIEVSNTITTNRLNRFLVTNTGTGTPQLGVYETQTQLFSKRIGVSQVRVYTEPTVAGNAFQLDIVGADGSIVPNGTYTYRFGDITDPQSGATSIERINFNIDAKTQYSLGIRITNLGTTNMTIKKIEIDVMNEGK